uniref:Mucin 15, cell surface associated n=1 Tax=Gasterosteus aculeatus aculeatus TaxID=481459 RepID=A0AAQ4RDM4_GASAC|nr:mucin-15 [Gasterosteus aculeatus aculeatus]XP_040023733.1 mucin-15 [Gasterosteus aculeatus aculeatus]
MGHYLRIAAGLLLLVQTFRLASLQDSTDSPRPPIPQSWLRELVPSVSQTTAVSEEEADNNADGIPSGSMMVTTAEEENVSGRDAGTTPPSFPTTLPTEQPDATGSPSAPTTVLTDETQTGEDVRNATTSPMSTTQRSEQTSAIFPGDSTGAGFQTASTAATSAPELNATQEPTTERDEATQSTNGVGPAAGTTAMTTASQGANETSTTSASTSAAPSASAGTSPAPTTPEPTTFKPTTAEPTTPEPTTPEPTTPKPTTSAPTTTAAPVKPAIGNRTGVDVPSGSSSEREDASRSGRRGAWGAVLGTAVAVAVVGLVAYVILKRKHQKGFSHSKLVEEHPSDPVLRLDNSAPLDLDFGIGRSAYYNPALQGDRIQMENLPGRR